jgi:hypothetical protein
MRRFVIGCLLAVLAAIAPMAYGQAAGDARVTVGGVTVLEFRASAGGFSPEQRKSALQSRIVEILSHTNLGPGHVRVVRGKGGHSARVMVGRMLLITATEADAQANRSTPEQLARTWAANFRRAFAAAKPRPTPRA